MMIVNGKEIKTYGAVPDEAFKDGVLEKHLKENMQKSVLRVDEHININKLLLELKDAYECQIQFIALEIDMYIRRFPDNNYPKVAWNLWNKIDFKSNDDYWSFISGLKDDAKIQTDENLYPTFGY